MMFKNSFKKKYRKCQTNLNNLIKISLKRNLY